MDSLINTKKEKLTPGQALPRLQRYCAYQERCQQEAREKLYSLGVFKTDAEQIIAQLIEEGFLDEERFAIQFAGSKFRIKHWGRIKIKYHLRQKGISDYCVKKALKAIPVADYQKTFFTLADKKWLSLKGEKNIFTKKRKTQDYLLSRGFETTLVQEYLSGQ
jgi:regulatory protein